MRALLPIAALFLLACQEEGILRPSDGFGGEGRKHLGRIESIHPHMLPTEVWVLEYAFAHDTAYIYYDTAKAMVQDSVWKKALTTRTHVFYSVSEDGKQCLYPAAPGIRGCLPFLSFEELYGPLQVLVPQP